MAIYGLSLDVISTQSVVISLLSIGFSSLGVPSLIGAGAKYSERTIAIKSAAARAKLATQKLNELTNGLEDSRRPPKR